MKKILILTTLALGLIGCQRATQETPFTNTAVQQAADAALQWQIEAYPTMNDGRIWVSHGDLSWENAIFLHAVISWGETTSNTTFLQWGKQVAERNLFMLSEGYNRPYHADDLAIGAFYARYFRLTGDSAALRSTYDRLRFIVDHPSYIPLELKEDQPATKDRWSWCDALYMAPPVFAEYAALMHDSLLLQFMHREYWATVDKLYSTQDSLFFRDVRYFTQKEANGQPIFWGRGNSWVFAGLAHLLPFLPYEMPERQQYVQLYQNMAARLVHLQRPEGYWTASLLDPDSYPNGEMSSTGLIAYGLWWGLNNGYLDPHTYLLPAQKAWRALLQAQHTNGMLGYVQPVGADPKAVTADMTEVYGAAAMAQTAEQILQWNSAFSRTHANRIQAIEKMLPDQPQGFGPTYHDRQAWEQLAAQIDTADLFARAEAVLATPMPEWSNDAYLDFVRTGNRAQGEEMIGRRNKRLLPLVWAECIRPSGRYIAQIEATLLAICANPSWTLPAHDPKLNNLYQRRYHVDLVAALLAQNLAQSLYMLNDAISDSVRQVVMEACYTHVLTPARISLESGNKENTWLYRKDNWNSVCLCGTVGAALFMLPSKEERAYWVATAEELAQYSIDGFSDDGYCSEGLGYFNYGFSNYMMLREEVCNATGGRIDLFSNPKTKRIVDYASSLEIQENEYPAFADCKPGTKPYKDVIWYCHMSMGVTSTPPYNPFDTILCNTSYNAMMWFPNSVSKSAVSASAPHQLPLRSHFADAGILICRNTQNNLSHRLSVALKGGHNGENHNHNDVGSFVVVKGDETLLGDIGGPYRYTKDMWTSKRYTYRTLSSFGHPVPLVDGQEQAVGAQAAAIVRYVAFHDDIDTLILDLTPAYPLPHLKQLTRTFIYSRTGNGSLCMIDEWKASQPICFESAITTTSDVQTNNQQICIKGSREAAELQVHTTQPYSITRNTLQENGPRINRLAFVLQQPAPEGVMSITIL